MIPRKARTRSKLKKVIFCRKCLYTFRNESQKIRVICPSCGAVIDGRNRRGWACRYSQKNFKRTKKWKAWLKTVDWKKHRAEQNRKERIRILLLVGKKEIRCVRCGCDDIRFLEINHKNGKGGKEFESGKYMREFYRKILRLERSVDDLEILCRVCNAHHYLELKYGKTKHRITFW